VPPNSQGYLTLAGAWLAAQLPLPDDPDDPLWAHYLIEAARQAGHDRNAVLHEHADGRELIAEQRLRTRLDAIDSERASTLAGQFDEGGTIYLCAADGDGMAVSLIQSNYSGFGSMVIVPGVRIFLHNRGAGFSLEPGHPAEYGPRRRPPHTLSPALVTKTDGSLDCVIGTMGGDSQPQVLLQLLARRFAASPRQDAGKSIAAARWALATDEVGYDVWADSGTVRVAIESHAPEAWFDTLPLLGHDVVRARSWTGDFGHAHLIALDGPTLAGAADPRSLGGSAAGY
jgi:gamma-glutamyltranspeptidase/glutathione hydrolase